MYYRKQSNYQESKITDNKQIYALNVYDYSLDSIPPAVHIQKMHVPQAT